MSMDSKNKASDGPVTDAFGCQLCQTAGSKRSVFKTAAALETHMRSKHGKRFQIYAFLDLSHECPVCLTKFGSRLGVWNHVNRKKKVRSRHVSCHEIIMAGLVDPVSHDEIAKAQSSDAEARAYWRKRGHQNPLVGVPAKRTCLRTIVPSPSCTVLSTCTNAFDCKQSKQRGDCE